MRPWRSLVTPWHVLLSLLSWAAQRFVRTIMLVGAAWRWRRVGGEQDCRWRGLSEVLEQGVARWFVMMVGPRWNCHAILADLGPLHVERAVVIEPAAPLRDGQHLSFVVYDARYRVAAHAVWTALGGAGARRLALAKGTYRVSARLYGFAESDNYPSVHVDERMHVAAARIGPEAVRYEATLCGLARHRSWLLAFIHYHVYHALRWRRLLGEARVRRMFVPVGNPSTAFAFGAIDQGQRLTLTGLNGPPPAAGERPQTFVAIYDRCSLPQYWCSLTGGDFQSQPVQSAGYFLVRTIASNVEALQSAVQALRWHCD